MSVHYIIGNIDYAYNLKLISLFQFTWSIHVKYSHDRLWFERSGNSDGCIKWTVVYLRGLIRVITSIIIGFILFYNTNYIITITLITAYKVRFTNNDKSIRLIKFKSLKQINIFKKKKKKKD